MAKRRKRVPPKTIFIACEGKNTEPIYFERIKEHIEDDNIFALTIYPDRDNDNHKSDPIGLIKEAQKRINDFDEVWVVYDKDGYTKHKEALSLAENEICDKVVNIAFSSISFEHWVLLHFEKNADLFIKSQEIIDQKFIANENYFPSYSKRGDIDIYPKIKDLTNLALENTAWLRYIKKADITSNPIFDVNPFTDVDVLVKKLFNIDENISYYLIGDIMSFDDVNIRANYVNGKLNFEINNASLNAIVLNEIQFSVVGNDSEKSLIFGNQVLTPNTPIQVEAVESDFSKVVVRFRNNRFVVVLE
jgi:hypothetical protein